MPLPPGSNQRRNVSSKQYALNRVTLGTGFGNGVVILKGWEQEVVWNAIHLLDMGEVAHLMNDIQKTMQAKMNYSSRMRI